MLKKLYFSILTILFILILTIVSFFFYTGYLKKESIKKERLTFYRIQQELKPFIKTYNNLNDKQILFLKNLSKNYNVDIVANFNNMEFSTNRKLNFKDIRTLYIKKWFRKKRTKYLFFKGHFFPEVKTCLLFKKGNHKSFAGIELSYGNNSIAIIEKNNFNTLFFPFSLLIIFAFFSLILFFAIKKIYVEPLSKLEKAIKEIEENIDSPFIFQVPSDGTQSLFKALNNLKKKIVHEINTKEEMIRDLSHDIKTPLTRLKLAAEFIKDKSLKESIIENINEIDQLTNSILLTAVFSKKRCSTRLIDVVEKVKEQYSEIQFIFEIEEDLEIPLCEEDLKRIFNNLIDNSIKYADIEKGITITGGKSKGLILIEYIDCNTKGEKPDLNRLFDYFYKKDPSRNKEKDSGFGLGLSIIKKIVESNNGRIEATYSNCNGLKFSISFFTKTKNN